MTAARSRIFPGVGGFFCAKIHRNSVDLLPFLLSLYSNKVKHTGRRGSVGAVGVPGAMAAFLPIIRKQHKQDKRPTQKRLKNYLLPIDNQSFSCYSIITKGQQSNTKRIRRKVDYMKRTKSMIYRPTEESRELFLYTVNDGTLYRTRTTPIIENLKKKFTRGVYDKEKAVDLFYTLACAGSEKYKKDFGYSFSVCDRFTAAVEFEEYYSEQIKEEK